MNQLPESVTTLIAWRTLSRLVLRHPQRDLRLMGFLDGNVPYRGFSVAQGTDLRVLLHLTVHLSPLLHHSETGKVSQPERHELFSDGLNDPAEPVERIEALLGLGVDTPPKSFDRRAVALLTLTTVLERTALGAHPVLMMNGWEPSNGWSPSKPTVWASQLPAVANLPEKATQPQQASAAGRLWGVGRRDGEPSVVVDVVSSAWWAEGRPQGSLWEGWSAGRSFRELAGMLEGELA